MMYFCPYNFSIKNNATITRVCRVILGSTYPDKYDVLDFLVEKHNHLQDQA